MSNNPERRWGCEGRGYSGSPHFWNAISKYGWDNFEHEILMTVLDITYLLAVMVVEYGEHIL